jgi:uncharacterized protein
MKLHADRFDAPSVTAYGEGWIAINGDRFDSSVLVSGSTGTQAVQASAADGVNAGLIEQVLALPGAAPELVLIGTGAKQQTVHPRLLLPLMERRIGAECMSTQAACRTYNILVSEGRRVCAIFLV